MNGKLSGPLSPKDVLKHIGVSLVLLVGGVLVNRVENQLAPIPTFTSAMLLIWELTLLFLAIIHLLVVFEKLCKKLDSVFETIGSTKAWQGIKGFLSEALRVFLRFCTYLIKLIGIIMFVCILFVGASTAITYYKFTTPEFVRKLLDALGVRFMYDSEMTYTYFSGVNSNTFWIALLSILLLSWIVYVTAWYMDKRRLA